MVDLYNLLSLCMHHSITTQFALAYFTNEATDTSERLRIPGLHRFDKLSQLHQRSRARLLRGNDDVTNAHASALSLLTEFKGWSVTDARDRIFAFYSLLPPENQDREALCPDYSLSDSQVYIKFAYRYIHRNKNLDILSVATHPDEGFRETTKDPELPSWVPDWRTNDRQDIEVFYKMIRAVNLGTHIIAFDGIYNASLGLEATPIDLEDSKTLYLNGVDVDRIEKIGELYVSHGDLLESLESYKTALFVYLRWRIL